MKKTHHSEYGRIESLYLKSVTQAFVSQQQISDQWKSLNYLGPPDFKTAKEEYAQFEKIISSVGSEINYFRNNSSVTMDSLYCRDASISTDYGIILCNMGKGGRINEPPAAELIYSEKGHKVLGKISSPGTLEGGDVAWINETTLAVGRTYRTNDAGIEQLRDLLEPKGIRIVQVVLPHYNGMSDVFHLMSILSPIDKYLAVVYSPLMPIAFREMLLDMNYKLVEVPDKEFESMGCNVLALEPRYCLMVEGNPVTQSRLENEGVIVKTYKGTEISIKGGGGPTCLTRPLLREIE